MHLIIISLHLIALLVVTSADYWSERAQLIKTDSSQSVGAQIVLNEKEQQVNKILMNEKLKECDSGFINPATFVAAQHFFKSKPLIEQTKVFEIIQKLPKGASLHSHDTAIVSQEFLFNLTYKEDLYVCQQDGLIQLHFFKSSNATNNACNNWTLLSEVRASDASFNDKLRGALTLIIDNPEEVYTDINIVWKTFSKIFATIGPLVTFKPVFEEYFYQVLTELYEDNVMYLEFRGLLPELYDLEGRIYNSVEVFDIYYEILQQFKSVYPKFMGAKFIYAPSRHVGNATIQNYHKILLQLQQNHPDFIAGFDLVGQEDLGLPLVDFITELQKFQNHTKFFFHAGETNWNGEATDLNIFDAILLNTTRIGHGYSVIKHPEVAALVRQKGIALEVSPISNQVLKLVDDIRNHPGSILLANGFPVVITCDDPTFWGAKGLSYDWYIAFMGLAKREDDLRLLKQLAINSLEYSEIDDKKQALKNWNEQWDAFLDGVLADFNVNVCVVNV